MENNLNLEVYTIDDVLKVIGELPETEKIVLLENFRVTDICGMLNDPDSLANWSERQIQRLKYAGTIAHAFGHIFDAFDKAYQDEELKTKIKSDLEIMSSIREDKQEV